MSGQEQGDLLEQIRAIIDQSVNEGLDRRLPALHRQTMDEFTALVERQLKPAIDTLARRLDDLERERRERTMDDVAASVEQKLKPTVDSLAQRLDNLEREHQDEHLRSAKERTFAALGPDGYRPTRDRSSPTGGSIIEPVDRWRRRPGY